MNDLEWFRLGIINVIPNIQEVILAQNCRTFVFNPKSLSYLEDIYGPEASLEDELWQSVLSYVAS